MVLIFDLDDTLIDTTRLIVPEAAQKACQILVDGGIGAPLSQLLKDRMQLAVGMSHSDIFPFLGKKYGFLGKNSDQILTTTQKATQAFYSPEITKPLPLIPGAEENLINYSKHFPLYLVTAGLEAAQQRKIEMAKISSHFKKIFIVTAQKGNTREVNGVKEKSKVRAFQEILQLENRPPEECLSIGNRLSSEIRDAKKCGMQTCYFEFGEHVGEIPQSPEEIPDFTIQSHLQLKDVCPLP